MFLTKACVLSCVLRFVTSWTVANHGEIPLSLEFSRQEYWSELPFPPPGNLPDWGIEPTSLAFLHWQAVLYQLSHWASPKWKLKSLSCVQLFATPWTIQSMEFSRPEYWSGWPFPSPGDLPNPGIKPRSPALQVDPLPAEPKGKPFLHKENI